ncbi:MAG: sel1 repeat family protein [Rhodospirillaceae bacterium]|nr:sel1 repeat family protein [Rhodospirillaceae bacterium]
MTPPSANAVPPAAALQADVTDCDILAANPPDPDRVVKGVPRTEVDLPRAIAACRAAVADRPDVARFSYQLGRCLFYAGQTEEAMATFKRAAELGYRQAHFIIAYIRYKQSSGVPFDLKEIEYHWRQASRLDHFNAQVAYVTMAVRGDFKGLPDTADKAEMRSFVEKARPHVTFAGDLLIENLLAALK